MPHTDTSCIIIIIIIVVKTLSEVVFWQEQGEELKESYEDPLSPCKTLTKCSGADLMKKATLNLERRNTRKTFSKLLIHPTLNLCFSVTCDLRAETWVRGGVGRQFPRNLN